MRYRYNPYCACARCRAHGYMGPAVLITLGMLFLFDQMRWMAFHRTWPALLIVIGLVLFLRHSAPIDGHIAREYAAPVPVAQTYYPAAPTAPVTHAPVVTPAPIQPEGNPPSATFGQTGSDPDNSGVHNG